MKKIYMIAVAFFALFSMVLCSCKDDPEPMPPDLSIPGHTDKTIPGKWVLDSSQTMTVYKDNSKPVETVSNGVIDGYYDFTANFKGDYKWSPDYGDINSWVLSNGGITITIQVLNKAKNVNESYIYKVMQNKTSQNIWQTETAYYKNGSGKEVKNIKKVFLKKIG